MGRNPSGSTTFARCLLIAASSVAVAGTAFAHDLPIGDGKYGSKARKGYVFSCQTRFNPNAPGAQASGKWLDKAKGTWDPDKKPIVDGEVSWPSKISIAVEGRKRVIRGNGLPDHPTGTYPVSRKDDAYKFDRNPNSIKSAKVLLQLDANPKVAKTPSCVPMGMIGFALTGAKIFNALDARGDDAPAHEIQDRCNGHPEHTGEYHYHNQPPCMSDAHSGPNGHSDLIGYALDGFGMFGPQEASGRILTTNDLDACHGHTGPVLWDGKVVTMYHYHFTADYPYTIGCFTGKAIKVAGQQAGGGQGRPPKGPPPPGPRKPPPPGPRKPPPRP